jgi:hypothetical protein
MGLKRPATGSEQCDQVAAMVAAGASFKEAGDAHGVSGAAAFKACERRGVRSIRARRPPIDGGKLEVVEQAGAYLPVFSAEPAK